jgi:DNA invertase Pin-like site-specific DNA recombinase
MESSTLYGAQVSAPAIVPAIQLRYCLYARKSSEAEEKQALSIDSQIKEMLSLAQREGLNIVDMYRESHSAKDCGQRPVFNQLISDIRSGKFDGILVWHPDRLSRNAGDLGAIVDLLDQKKLIEIRTFSQRFTNNPNEKFLLMILGSQAKLENDNKSINVKRGLRTRVESGLWPSVAPTGYLNHPDRTMKCHVIVDPLRSHVIRLMFEKAAYEKFSIRKLFRWLKDDVRFVTKNGKPLTLSNVQIILRNNFYMGMIEYPRKSGKWYLGRHEPIVDKELFKKVQERLDANKGGEKTRKEFAFTRLMKCGMCKSGVCAEEKHKNLINGDVARYVYYGCTRFNDKNCKNTYLREEDLISQLLEIIDRIDINNVGIKSKLEKEIERYGEFRNKVLELTDEEKITKTNLDVRSYMKYLLKEGTIQEKRDLMQSFTSKLVLINKRVVLE